MKVGVYLKKNLMDGVKMIYLKARDRQKKTKGYLNDIRRGGGIPGVCYGGEDLMNVVVRGSDFRDIFSRVGKHKIFYLEIEGKGDRRVMVKDCQWNVVSKAIEHIDFFEVGEKDRVQVEVPVRLEGLAEGVRLGGVLEKKLYGLRVEAISEDIPGEFVVGIGGLKVGDLIYVRDLEEVKGVKVLTGGDQIIVMISESRVTKTSVQEEEGENEKGEKGKGEKGKGEKEKKS